MRLTQAKIERIRRVNPDIWHLELGQVDESLFRVKPGQTLLARIVDDEGETLSWDPYLREQWWPLGMTGQKTLLVERAANPRYEPGQHISLIGPVGEPYRFGQRAKNILLLAYDTAPTPLTVMIPWLLRHSLNVTLVLLGRARRYNTDHLSAEVEVIRGDDDGLGWPDQVMSFGWADQMFTVVSPDDELLRFGELRQLALERKVAIPNHFIYGVFQPVTVCGTGACYSCALRMSGSARPHLTCVDGPAFDLLDVRLD
ncbi:hypothetical protein G4Y79_08280 [Phototrophicus methaneseepsis]|uniref:Dihydroorotate dehydrogenase electron transfer subunit iron-sulphur cluster binding domain-containing protein n=1 Tax=Phototrophicus methaneseepsis TaxID=2710758 RepID=A0A7S8IGQ9_9CHLR|nr:hypothetical protein [Phototrophicus methaneseepsis]QPC84358.1 hypothetical protein G4Y79_08280 [Phototrophicus methaneseepsis]